MRKWMILFCSALALAALAGCGKDSGFSPQDANTTHLSAIAPSARALHSAALDMANNRMFVFGGYDGTHYLNDLWAYTPSSGTWLKFHSGATPRLGQSAVWDARNNQLLVFGGYAMYNPPYIMNDLWAYNPSTDTWRQLSSGATARYGHTAVWDTQNSQMLVFGGDNISMLLNDLWAYNPSTDTWRQLSSGATARSMHSAVWDAGNGQMLVFGGNVSYSGASTNDIWTYKTSTDAWMSIPPAGGAIMTGRYGHTAVWDMQSNQMLVFGGYTGSNQIPTGILVSDVSLFSPLTDTWVYRTGATEPRYGHAAVWYGNGMLVFGGYDGSNYINDVLMYLPSTDSWQKLSP